MNRVALMTGISGQDGSYLTELLHSKGYEVHGVVQHDRRHLCPGGVYLHFADMADGTNLPEILTEVAPQEVYNLGALSHVKLSFELPIYTADVTGVGVLRMLEATRLAQERTGQQIRFYQASSSEMFGKVQETPQTETTPFHPRSPYACAKVFGYYQTLNYREAYGMFTCNGILFNHESPRRGEDFVTRKITRAATRIKLGLQEKLFLGNLDAQRDWGFAGDYVEAMWLMLQQDQPDDYVVATGEMHSVKDFLREVFGWLDLDWEQYVEVDPRFFRPTEVDQLQGDASKARKELGWQPRVDFAELARMMTEHDLQLAEREKRGLES